jgi:erythromycin esterase
MKAGCSLNWIRLMIIGDLLIVWSCVALALPEPSPGPDSTAAFVSWAASAAIRIHSLEPGPDVADLAPICELVGTAPVVAFGEPDHGAHEPLAFRNRLFAYFVEHCGFTAIALESSFTESRTLYDYVLGGEGDAGQVAWNGFTWDFGGFAENVELIRWIRQYNERAGTRRRIHIYGVDLSGSGNNGDFPRAERALSSAVQYIRRTAPAASRRLTDLDGLLDRLPGGGYKRMAVSNDPALRNAIAAISRFLIENQTALRRADSKVEYDWAVQNVYEAQRLVEFLKLEPYRAPDDDTFPTNLYDSALIRESAMADGALWALKQEGASGRVLVFAHDLHLMKTARHGGVWADWDRPKRKRSYKGMGQYLEQALGKRMVVIGTVSGRKAAALADQEPLANQTPPANSVEAALGAVGVSPFIVDLRPGRSVVGVAQWLGSPRSFGSNFGGGANFNMGCEIAVQDGFDALLYIDLVTPAVENPRASTRL